MFVLEIIPLSRTAPAEPLSYRSSVLLAVGTIVNVPLRRKIVPGLVVGSVPVREAKAELKRASFSLSKASAKEIGKLPTQIMKSASLVATYHATTLGAVLSTLLVPVLSETAPEKFSKGDSFEIERVEAPLLDRRAAYQKIVEGNTKKKGVTLLVVPTQAEVDEWWRFFKSLKPVVISGKLSIKKRDTVIAAVAELHEGLVITTLAFSWIPLSHLSTIIIERVSAGGYVLPKRPYIDVRYALASLAQIRNAQLIYGDYPLPLEYRAKPEKPLAKAPLGKVTVFDARTDKDVMTEKERQHVGEGPWKAVPNDLLREIKKVLAAKGRVAVLAVRKGYAPTVVCRDCGTAVTDQHGRTLMFTTAGGKRLFRSVDGTTVEAAHTKCKVCDSWNLLPLGIGVERVDEELKKAFPDADPDSVVVGTEAMLSELSPEKPFELGIIASADSLLALPFWRSRERFVRVGLMLAERSQKVIVATRHPEDAALSALVSPTTSDFWKEELNLRKILKYPPFGTLIVFEIEASSARLAQARADITAACAPYVPIELAPRPISATILRGISVLHLSTAEWPDQKLSEKLARLSPAIRVHIDLESLW